MTYLQYLKAKNPPPVWETEVDGDGNIQWVTADPPPAPTIRKFKPSVMRALGRIATPARCRAIAEKILSMAEGGDPKMIDTVLDRLDGRVPQTLQLDTEVHVHHSMPGPTPQKCIEGVYELDDSNITVQDDSDELVQDDDPFE